MINKTRLLKVSVAWTSVAYTACYAAVWAFPSIREVFLSTALHANVPITSGPFTVGNFVAGLIIWNGIAILAAWLFARLWNTIKS